MPRPYMLVAKDIDKPNSVPDRFSKPHRLRKPRIG